MVDNTSDNDLRVGARTPPADLASAISHGIYDGKTVTLRSIGAGAVNQATKAIAIAQGYVAPRGIVLHNIIGFASVNMPDKPDTTAIIHRVFAA